MRVFFVIFVLPCFLVPFAEASSPTTVWTFELRRWGEPPSLILLTGFGPFGNIADNPSGRIVQPLAETLRDECHAGFNVEPHQLSVRPGIIDTLPLHRYRKIISIGVDAGSSGIRIETLATNYYHDPFSGRGGPIDPRRPPYALLAGGPIPLGIDRPTAGFAVTLGGQGTAGTYVCNDTFYRICQRSRAGYFIHIPNTPPEDDGRLAKALGHVACRLLQVPTSFNSKMFTAR